ncbi:MAG: hypothetical protein HY904_07610 [Deltaproteobacteria bacterium]|nr:hypothetical protein [Deltaproteobacteria bacterium]
MLGERIGEGKGKVTVERVLATKAGEPPQMEICFKQHGTLLGVSITDTGTYCSALRPDGTLFGEGQGVVMSDAGDAATWVGEGVGTLKKDGAASYRGALYFRTQASKWARLNSCAVLFEYEVDAQGNTRSTSFEWK